LNNLKNEKGAESKPLNLDDFTDNLPTIQDTAETADSQEITDKEPDKKKKKTKAPKEKKKGQAESNTGF